MGRAGTVRGRLAGFAWDAADSDEVRLEKVAIFVVAGSCCLAGVVWTAMYAVVFGWGLTTALPAAFVVLVGGALAVSHVTRNHRYAVFVQIACITQITAFIHWSIGGVLDSGFVVVWALIGPVAALVFYRPRVASAWFGLYLANVGAIAAFGDLTGPQTVPDGVRTLFLGMNLSIASLVVFVFAVYFVDRARDQRRRADDLLLNILPPEVAPRLKRRDSETIADAYDSASVLFADMVGSTPTFAGLPPGEVIDWLNEVFTMFDRLTERHDVEKIRTIGDNYMVASGVPRRRPDHAAALVRFGLDLLDGLDRLPERHGRRMQFRVGIHSGPLVAGVIGERKFQYDLWGDTVNCASRMESHGEAGRLHISDATHTLLRGAFDATCRGPLEIKGKGTMTTWFVSRPAARPGPPVGSSGAGPIA